MLETILGGLLVFALRLGDVPIGTLRTMLMVQGRRGPVAALAVMEATIWIVAVSRVLNGDVLNSPIKVAGYAIGFAAGTILGMAAESWLAIGHLLARVISSKSGELRKALLEAGFGVTAVAGEGRGGAVLILFIVARRKRSRELLRMIQHIDPQAFITTEPVGKAIGGYQVHPEITAMVKR